MLPADEANDEADIRVWSACCWAVWNVWEGAALGSNDAENGECSSWAAMDGNSGGGGGVGSSTVTGSESSVGGVGRDETTAGEVALGLKEAENGDAGVLVVVALSSSSPGVYPAERPAARCGNGGTSGMSLLGAVDDVVLGVREWKGRAYRYGCGGSTSVADEDLFSNLADISSKGWFRMWSRWRGYH